MVSLLDAVLQMQRTSPGRHLRVLFSPLWSHFPVCVQCCAVGAPLHVCLSESDLRHLPPVVSTLVLWNRVSHGTWSLLVFSQAGNALVHLPVFTSTSTLPPALGWQASTQACQAFYVGTRYPNSASHTCEPRVLAHRAISAAPAGFCLRTTKKKKKKVKKQVPRTVWSSFPYVFTSVPGPTSVGFRRWNKKCPVSYSGTGAWGLPFPHCVLALC